MQLKTSGQIAETLGVDRGRVAYLLRRARVRPVGRAGIIRLYPPIAIEVIEKLLQYDRLPASQIESVMSAYPAVVA